MNENGNGITRAVVPQIAPVRASRSESNPTITTIGFSSGLP